ncbi:MAG: ABC transporter substrate-binding protein [Acidobacteriota bacterium]
MKPIRCATVLALLAVLLVSRAEAAPVEIKDDLGRTIKLEAPAKRAVALYGAFAEMFYAIGAGPELIARTQADVYPPKIEKLPSVGTHMRPNMEMIMALKPDLVVQSASRNEDLSGMEALRGAGIPVAVFSPDSFEGLFSTMVRLGVLTGHEAGAGSAVEGLRKRLDEVKGRLDTVQARHKVFFEVRAEPLTGAGTGSIVQKILEAAGAENVLKVDKSLVQFNVEALLASEPDVYIVQRGPMNKNPLDPKNRPHFERLRAVQEGRIIFVDEFLYSRPGPRCVDAVEELAGALYPETKKSR